MAAQRLMVTGRFVATLLITVLHPQGTEPGWANGMYADL